MRDHDIYASAKSFIQVIAEENQHLQSLVVVRLLVYFNEKG